MKTLTLISWNVNGIRAVMKKGFMDFVKTHDPDILCLQETKAERGQAEIDLPEYSEYWNSAVKKGYSGTAIFTKQKPLTVANGFTDLIAKKYDLANDVYGDPMKEGRVITAEFETFFVVTVYTPNTKPDLSRLKFRHEQWDPAFLAHCKSLEKSAKGGSASGGKKPVIFCGDLNVAHTDIDLANPKANEGEHGFTAEEREGFEQFLDSGFVDTFRLFHPNEKSQYTWWTHWANARARNVGWRIDYVMASKALRKKINDAFILPQVMGSDHCPVGITLSL